MTRTVFDRIITNENSFTELFKNFLRFKAFRQSFLDLMEIEFDLGAIDHDSFDTQFSISEFGRPDLALITEDSEILFEIKVYNTPLTDNQPTGYFNYLKSKSKAETKGLILIIPENYYDVNRYNSKLEEIKKDADGIYTQIIHWEEISKIITDNELDGISPLFDEYSSFIIDWFQLRSIFYDSLNTTTMFGKNFPESLKKTMEIIDCQFNEFQKQGYELKWSKKKDFSEYGFYFVMPNEPYGLFLGIWFTYWETSGNPVCIALHREVKEKIESFESGIRRADLNPTKDHEGWLVTFIDKQTLMDEKCGQKITKAVSEIITKMDIKRSIE
jgi:hypothetical protein